MLVKTSPSQTTGAMSTNCSVALVRCLLHSCRPVATESGFSSGPGGALTLLGATQTDPGTVDASATPDGSFLYVQAGANGNVDAYRINGDGSLTQVDSVLVPGAAGGEGIVAL